MARLFSVLVFLFASVSVFAASNDSEYVVHRGDGWMIKHEIRKGDNLFSLSRHYHVPPAILSDANKLPYAAPLIEHSNYYIPIGAYNSRSSAPENMEDLRPLYYVVSDETELRVISKYSNVPLTTLQRWNHMSGKRAQIGDVLFVGWVLYDITEPVHQTVAPQTTQVHNISVESTPPPQANPHEQVTIIRMPDTTAKPVSKDEQTYMSQTNNGQSANEEKGSAAFFESAHHGDTYLAFHNGTTKDKIIKVTNPGNGKYIFVHCIGAVPEIKLYNNCIIGISSNARAALGADGDKAWVDLSFGY